MHIVLLLILLLGQANERERYKFTLVAERDPSGVQIEVEVKALPSDLNRLRELLCHIKSAELPASAWSPQEPPTRYRAEDYPMITINLFPRGERENHPGYKFVQQRERVYLFLMEPPLGPRRPPGKIMESGLQEFACTK